MVWCSLYRAGRRCETAFPSRGRGTAVAVDEGYYRRALMSREMESHLTLTEKSSGFNSELQYILLIYT